jgi:predicted dehydrogenase
MADRIRVGLVGANAEGGSWGARAHVPALQAMSRDYELKAICTAHEDTAQAAAKAFGAELAYHDYNKMFANPDIDVVSVAVRVPFHHEITMAALKAGKNVYCEWPLGANLDQAQEMADTAREMGVQTMTGLQAESDPAIMYARDLIRDGYVGDVVACHMTQIGGGGGEVSSARAWRLDRTKGANTMTINGGHSIGALCFVAGEFDSLSAKIATQTKQVKVSDTGQMADVTSPDNVLVSGVLDNGAVASVHVCSVPYPGAGGFRLDIYGREGTISMSGGQPNYSQAPLKLLAAKGREPLAELPIPTEYILVPEGTPDGAGYNVAQAYARFADALRSGQRVTPDFDSAVIRHRMIAALEESSEVGRVVKLH